MKSTKPLADISYSQVLLLLKNKSLYSQRKTLVLQMVSCNRLIQDFMTPTLSLRYSALLCIANW